VVNLTCVRARRKERDVRGQIRGPFLIFDLLVGLWTWNRVSGAQSECRATKSTSQTGCRAHTLRVSCWRMRRRCVFEDDWLNLGGCATVQFCSATTCQQPAAVHPSRQFQDGERIQPNHARLTRLTSLCA
jgi:hypothetical protein